MTFRIALGAAIIALAASAVAVSLVPLMPWLLFWSYLVITHLFLQVLSDQRERSALRSVASIAVTESASSSVSPPSW